MVEENGGARSSGETVQIILCLAFRDCLVSQSAGEHEGFLAQRRTTFEVRSPATDLKSGRRWAEKTRAQPDTSEATDRR